MLSENTGGKFALLGNTAGCSSMTKHPGILEPGTLWTLTGMDTTTPLRQQIHRESGNAGSTAGRSKQRRRDSVSRKDTIHMNEDNAGQVDAARRETTRDCRTRLKV